MSQAWPRTEIWSNESQERYVLAVSAGDFERFKAICVRERCAVAVIGEATEEAAPDPYRQPLQQHRRSTCRSKCCWASRQHAPSVSP